MSHGRFSRGRFVALAGALAMLTLGIPAGLPEGSGPVGAAAPPITVSIGSGSVVVSAAGEHAISFPITLSARSTRPISVQYRTQSGTAKPGTAYKVRMGTARFKVNPRTLTTGLVVFVTVKVNAGAVGTSRSFKVALSHPVGANIANGVGVGTIVGRPGGNKVVVSAGDMQVYDGTGGGNRLARVHVTLSRAAAQLVVVRYAITGQTARPVTNFDAPTKGHVIIPKGELGTWVNVGVVSGSVSGQAKRLGLRILSASGLALARADATITLLPEPSDQSYLFDDEFDGTTLDTSKWQPNWLGNNNSTITPPINGSEESCYDPGQVSESGGYLHLTATRRTCRASNGVTYSSASGLVESLPHFTFTHGYMEARMYLPNGSGQTTNWPAFWADGTGNWPSTGELDVMEGLHGQDCFHFHSPSGGPGGCAPLSIPSGWHTFGARWDSGSVTYYYDGRQVGTVTSGITDSPMYLILNLAVGGEGGSVVLPSTVLVDYVRVTQ